MNMKKVRHGKVKQLFQIMHFLLLANLFHFLNSGSLNHTEGPTLHWLSDLQI